MKSDAMQRESLDVFIQSLLRKNILFFHGTEESIYLFLIV